jgi:hypothetical protein
MPPVEDADSDFATQRCFAVSPGNPRRMQLREKNLSESTKNRPAKGRCHTGPLCKFSNHPCVEVSPFMSSNASISKIRIFSFVSMTFALRLNSCKRWS